MEATESVCHSLGVLAEADLGECNQYSGSGSGASGIIGDAVTMPMRGGGCVGIGQVCWLALTIEASSAV